MSEREEGTASIEERVLAMSESELMNFMRVGVELGFSSTEDVQGLYE